MERLVDVGGGSEEEGVGRMNNMLASRQWWALETLYVVKQS